MITIIETTIQMFWEEFKKNPVPVFVLCAISFALGLSAAWWLSSTTIAMLEKENDSLTRRLDAAKQYCADNTPDRVPETCVDIGARIEDPPNESVVPGVIPIFGGVKQSPKTGSLWITAYNPKASTYTDVKEVEALENGKWSVPDFYVGRGSSGGDSLQLELLLVDKNTAAALRHFKGNAVAQKEMAQALQHVETCVIRPIVLSK